MVAILFNNAQVVNNGIKINGVVIVLKLLFGMEHIVLQMLVPMEELGIKL